MSRSYKLCPVDFFNNAAFETQTFSFSRQMPLPQVAQPAQTTIRRQISSSGIEDFETYVIEHEREVTQRGRFDAHKFNKYIQTAEIAAFYSQQRKLLLLSGRKNDILDFCARQKNGESMRFTTVKINMSALLEKLSQVRLVWFRHDSDASIHASALMGQHVEKTTAFQEARNGAAISTLSFFIEDAEGAQHCVLVTSDGAIVPQGNYERSLELELVLFTKDTLLDPLVSALPFDGRSKRR